MHLERYFLSGLKIDNFDDRYRAGACGFELFLELFRGELLFEQNRLPIIAFPPGVWGDRQTRIGADAVGSVELDTVSFHAIIKNMRMLVVKKMRKPNPNPAKKCFIRSLHGNRIKTFLEEEQAYDRADHAADERSEPESDEEILEGESRIRRGFCFVSGRRF